MAKQVHLEFVKIVESAIQTAIFGAAKPMEMRKVLMSHWIWFIKDFMGMDAEKIVEVFSREEKFWKLAKEFERYELPEFSFLRMLRHIFLITGGIIEAAESGREIFPTSAIFKVDLINYSAITLIKEAKDKLGTEMKIEYPNIYHQVMREADYFPMLTA